VQAEGVTSLRPGLTTTGPAISVLIEQVTERLREAVISGVLARGQVIDCRALAILLGASASVIAGALAAASSEGFVGRAGSRWIVAPLRLEARTLLRRRLACEPLLTRRAAALLTPFGLRRLDRLQQELVAAQHRQDVVAVQRGNYRFHAALYEAAARPDLHRQARSLWAGFPFDLLTTLPQRMSAVAEEHVAILRALRRGDGDAAAQAMREHILQGWHEFRLHYPLDLAARRRQSV
jgi:DNA-binding GntR family transcriptional regulator